MSEERIKKLEETIDKLREHIQSAKDCLTSGNSERVSDPRPALKYLNKALEDK